MAVLQKKHVRIKSLQREDLVGKDLGARWLRLTEKSQKGSWKSRQDGGFSKNLLGITRRKRKDSKVLIMRIKSFWESRNTEAYK